MKKKKYKLTYISKNEKEYAKSIPPMAVLLMCIVFSILAWIAIYFMLNLFTAYECMAFIVATNYNSIFSFPSGLGFFLFFQTVPIFLFELLRGIFSFKTND